MMPPEAITGTATASTTCGHQRHRADQRVLEGLREAAAVAAGLGALRDHRVDAGALEQHGLLHRGRGADGQQARRADRGHRFGRQQPEGEADRDGPGGDRRGQLRVERGARGAGIERRRRLRRRQSERRVVRRHARERRVERRRRAAGRGRASARTG
jgi:hypothetical protein